MVFYIRIGSTVDSPMDGYDSNAVAGVIAQAVATALEGAGFSILTSVGCKARPGPSGTAHVSATPGYGDDAVDFGDVA